ncbi:MAG: DUF4157 domain-containing protein [Myxococcales bacterium]|nr:DUF4157 domain-containing protein [Myxococcales bacterium]
MNTGSTNHWVTPSREGAARPDRRCGRGVGDFRQPRRGAVDSSGMFDFAPGADFEAERADDEDVEPARQGGVPGKGSRIAAIFGLVQRRANDSGAARGVMSQAGGAAAGGATAAGGAAAGGAAAGGAAVAGGAAAGGAAAGGASAGRGEVAGPADDPFGLHLAAAHGVSGAGTALPYRAELERAMGVDLGGIVAHVGGAAADACAALDARAYATGDRIAFGSAPDLHTAAHEVAHVLQQRAGIELPGGIGAAGDAHERAADDIADAVVRGESVIGRLPTGGARAARGTAVQRAGMGDVRRVEGGQQLEVTEAEFLAQLHESHVRVGPRPLRMEPGRPHEVAVRVFSPAAPPRGAKPMPIVCDLRAMDGEVLAIDDGVWRAEHHRSPVLRFTVQEPARYEAVVRVNAGRPGERVLTTSFRVTRATERTVAHDQGARLAKGHGTVASTTYRDLLAAVVAAQTLTDAGDPKSYQRALALLEPVRERLWAIYPNVVEARTKFGFARNVMDLHFDGARGAIDGWVARLHMGGTIATKELVTRFEAAETEIKLGTGEQADTKDLRAADAAAWRTTKVVGVATAVVVLVPVAVEIGAAAGVEVIPGMVMRWAGTHPFLALAVAEFVLANGIAIGEAGGLDNYIEGLKADPFATGVQVFLDFVAIWLGHGADQPDVPNGGRRGGMRGLPPGEAPARAPKQLGPGSGEEGGRTPAAPTGAVRPRAGGPAEPEPPPTLGPSAANAAEASPESTSTVPSRPASQSQGRDLGLRSDALEALQTLESVGYHPLGKVNSEPDHNHFGAARREAAGEVVARRPDGRPYSHIGELQRAHNALDNVRRVLGRELAHPPPTMTDRGRDVLMSKHAEVQAMLSRLKGFLGGIGHGPPFPPFHEWPPGS